MTETAELVEAPTGSADLGSDTALRGFTWPRIATIDPDGASRGREVVAFARDVLRLPLLPWQSWVLDHGLVVQSDRWASRTVAVLVGRQNGKTTLVGIRALAGMVLFGEREVLAAAQNRDVALDSWRHALDLALDAGLDVHSVRRTNGREEFWIGDARYKVVSATRGGGRGLSADLVILDELREYRDESAWAALEKTRRARESSQCWAISNEGDEGSVVLSRLAEQGRHAADVHAPTDLAWFEWSAEPERARDDRLAWQQSNPALGSLVTADTIASEAAHDDPIVFETEVLCRRVATLRPWLSPGAWEACAESSATAPDGVLAFALEAGPEFRHATIAVAIRRGDGRVYVEAVDGFHADGGPVLARASERLAELVERWPASAVHVVARSASEAAAIRALEDRDVSLVALSGADFVRAVNAFREAVIARQVVHSGDPMTAAHVGAVTADGTMRRRNSGADIDAATAIVLARHGALHAPAKPETQDWVAF